jgi:hypothetical protein
MSRLTMLRPSSPVVLSRRLTGVPAARLAASWRMRRSLPELARLPLTRLLDPLAQAVLVIEFLRTNITCAELAAGFVISESTCRRNIREGSGVLADRGRRISLADVAKLAVKMGWDYAAMDGTHVPMVTFGRKTAGQKAYYPGKHKRHGLNVQTVCSPDGGLLWTAAPRPSARWTSLRRGRQGSP